MGKRCVVPKCKSGYDSCPEKVSMFSIPKNKLEVWQKAIPRTDRLLTYRDSVCEKHFKKKDVIRIIKTQVYTYNLKTPKLSSDAVPSIFPTCPKYEFRPRNKKLSEEAYQKQVGIKKVSSDSLKYMKKQKVYQKTAMRVEFMNRLLQDRRIHPSCNSLTKQQYEQLTLKVLKAKLRPAVDGILKNYDIVEVGSCKKLIARYRREGQMQFFVHDDELFNLFQEVHFALKHAGRYRMYSELRRTYKNINYRDIVTYLDLCISCVKKQRPRKKMIVVANVPIIYHNSLSSTCYINIIDCRANPDDDYNFVLVYQNQMTKFCMLKALKSKTSDEIFRSVCDIFTFIGIPAVIHSDCGGELMNDVIKRLQIPWPKLEITHIKCEENEYVERVNEDLVTWMERNRSEKWSRGLHFIQSSINNDFHEGINSTPRDALFGLSTDEEEAEMVCKAELKVIKEENVEIISCVCDICGNETGTAEICAVCDRKPVITQNL